MLSKLCFFRYINKFFFIILNPPCEHPFARNPSKKAHFGQKRPEILTLFPTESAIFNRKNVPLQYIYAQQSMKKFTFVTIILMTVWSCADSPQMAHLKEIDSLIYKKHYGEADSLMALTERGGLRGDDEKAYYGLLKSALKYCMYEVIIDDSLIDRSIEYYKKTKDYDKLAQSYYFKGCNKKDLGDVKGYVWNLKSAEEAINRVENDFVACKIYNCLTSVNIDAMEPVLAQKNGIKAVYHGEKSGSKNHLVYSYANYAMAQLLLGKVDSSIYYAEKSLPLIKYQNEKGQLNTYMILGGSYEMRNPRKAREYALKVLDIKPVATAYHLLGSIYMREGNLHEAESCFVKGISVSKYLMRTISITEDLADCLQKEGNTAEAARLLKQAQTMRDSLIVKDRNDSVAALQDIYDAQKAERQAIEEGEASTRKAMASFAALLASIIATGMIYHKKNKVNTDKLKAMVETQDTKLKEQRETLAKLMESGQAGRKEVERMRKQIKRMEEKQKKLLDKIKAECDAMAKAGHELYMQVEREENISQWGKREQRCFVEYYCMLDCDYAECIEATYDGLTYRQKVFLILWHMGKSDGKVMEMMAISGENLRKIRSTINARKKATQP